MGKYLTDGSFNKGRFTGKTHLGGLKEGQLFIPCRILDVNESMIPLSCICCAVFLDDIGEF